MSIIFFLLLYYFLGTWENIYFPNLYEDSIYLPYNLDLYPETFYTYNKDETRIVQFYIENGILLGLINYSSNSSNDCIVFKLNLTNIASNCETINSAIKLYQIYGLLSLRCKVHSFVLLTILSESCYDRNSAEDSIGIFKSLTSTTNISHGKHGISLDMFQNITDSIVLSWETGLRYYGILRLKNEEFKFEDDFFKLKLEFNIFGDIFNISQLEIIDLKLAGTSILMSMSDGCIYYCDAFNCKNLSIINVWKCKATNGTKIGSITVSKSGEKAIHLQTFYEGIATKRGSTTIATYVVQFNVINMFGGTEGGYFKQCGSIMLSDIVFVYSREYDGQTMSNPCKLGYQGSLLACLILGEPYIFDISDCNSAHPISSFGISSIRTGFAINRFDFLHEDLFFYETIRIHENSENNTSQGLVFEIKQELQPTLIASHVIYPTLASAVTPAESFILVNHINGELWFFTRAGRIFQSESRQNYFEVQLTYRHDLSFFISDILQLSNTSQNINVPHSYNFEHPYGYLSPNKSVLVYLSYYQSSTGSFTASAISVVKLNEVKKIPRSIIQLGQQGFVIQSGVDKWNNIFIIVFESFAKDYLNIKISTIDRIPSYSFGTKFVLSQTEVAGQWVWSDFSSRESSRIWVIPFDEDNSFYITSHNVTNTSTLIHKYSIKSDYSISILKTYEIPNCFIVSNINDYINSLSIILCASKASLDDPEQLFTILIANISNNWIISCKINLIHFSISARKPYDSKILNIPLFDYDPTNRRLVISVSDTIYSYSTISCPFTVLYHHKNHHTVSAIATVGLSNKNSQYTVTLISYLQRLDALGDCTNGYGVIDIRTSTNLFCVRCSPGKFGLGCMACTPGFFCQGYSQLQPTGPCPEGYYCLEGTSSLPPNISVELNFEFEQFLPQKCPEGSYCPAGTATLNSDELSHNNPKPCLEGFYCPLGSSKPTQKSCPFNSISAVGAKSKLDCKCKPGFYGDASEFEKCVPCLPNGNCSNEINQKYELKEVMEIPKGYWPNIPDNTLELLPCDKSLSGQTPCIGGTCEFICYHGNENKIGSNISCRTVCRNVCMVGQENRLCSQCSDKYYKNNSSLCRLCEFDLRQAIIFIVMTIISTGTVLILASRNLKICESLLKKKEKEYAANNKNLISNELVLELLLALILIVLGMTSTFTLLLLFFVIIILYIQQLKTRPYALNIFIFYIQTLWAFTGRRLIYPSYIRLIFTFFDILYNPFPGISCIPNIFTNKNLGWIGENAIIFFLPIASLLMISLITLIISKWKNKLFVKPFLTYFMFMSVLQFPLSNLSLSVLSCNYDKVTDKYYVISLPWMECSLLSPIQICGVVGIMLYFIGIPATLHFWYWKHEDNGKSRVTLSKLILPGGTQHDLPFFIFLTFRGMSLVILVSIIPPRWNITNLCLFLLLGTNLIVVLIRKPYVNCSFNTSHIFIEFLKTGHFLEASAIFLILTSVFLLDSKIENIRIEIRSIIVGIANLIYTLLFIFGVIFENRLAFNFI